MKKNISSRSTGRILIVDDDRRNINLLSFLLAETGHEIIETLNPLTALLLAETKSPDLILLDIMMPEMDGFKLCRHLKKNLKTSHIPVIFLSAMNATRDRIFGFKVGAVDYISKPYKTEEVIARVNTHLTLRHLQKELENANNRLEERVKARTNELRESEAKYRSLVESANTVPWKMDLKTGEFTYIGRQVENILGYPLKSWIDLPVLSSRIHEDDRGKVERLFNKPTQEYENHEFEYRAIAADGSIVWIRNVVTSVADKGLPKELIGFMFDISKRKEMEEARAKDFHIQSILHSILVASQQDLSLMAVLEQSLELILSIQDFSCLQKGAIFLTEKKGGSLMLSAQHNFTKSQQALCATIPFGVCHCGRTASAAEVVFSECVDHHHEISYEGMEPHGHYCVPILSGKEVIGVLNTYVKAGSQRDTDLEQLLIMLAHTLAGIIERRRAEKEVMKLTRAVEQSATSVVITNTKGDIEYVNPSFTESTGYAAAEVLGKNLRILKSGKTPEEEYSKMWDIITRGEEWRGEICNVKKTGELFWEEGSISPIRSKSGAITHFLAVKLDITKKKEAEEKLLRSRRALKALSACNQAMIHARTEQKLLDNICRIIIKEGGYRLAWVGYVVNDRKKTVQPVASFGEVGYLKNIEVRWSDTKLGRGPVGTSIRTGNLSVIKGVDVDPNFSPWFKAANNAGLNSTIGMPLIVNDNVLGTLAIYSSEPDAFDAEEISLLKKLSDNLSHGIKTVRQEIERKKTEKRLRSLEKALETTTMGVTITDNKGKILYVNQAEAETHGYLAGELIGKSSGMFAPPHLRKRLAPVEFREKTKKRESINIRKNGDIFPVNLISDVVRDSSGNSLGIVTISEDITERKQFEKELKNSRKQLKNLIEHTENVREEERRRIARDIHDELGQVLTVFTFDLAWISKRLNKDQVDITNKIAATSKLVNEAIESVQKIADKLRPTILDDLGLVAALEWQSSDLESRTGIICSLTIEPEEMIVDNNLSTEIFRIFQESLTNVARHAEATRISASMHMNDGGLYLSITDNGKGISASEIASSNSIGLIGMRERLYPWKGTVDIEGVKGKGTTVRINVPALYKNQDNN
ncbi:MAG: PAS domain S-box protein [bacterium]|nr:PAS domain S-box protein [bacterium]